MLTEKVKGLFIQSLWNITKLIDLHSCNCMETGVLAENYTDSIKKWKWGADHEDVIGNKGEGELPGIPEQDLFVTSPPIRCLDLGTSSNISCRAPWICTPVPAISTAELHVSIAFFLSLLLPTNRLLECLWSSSSELWLLEFPLANNFICTTSDYSVSDLSHGLSLSTQPASLPATNWILLVAFSSGSSVNIWLVSLPPLWVELPMFGHILIGLSSGVHL
jgi:hypothetical protein